MKFSVISTDLSGGESMRIEERRGNSESKIQGNFFQALTSDRYRGGVGRTRRIRGRGNIFGLYTIHIQVCVATA